MDTPWLWLHGALGTGSQFDDFKRYFPNQVIYSPNLPGHGNEPLSMEMSIPNLSSYLLKYLNENEIDQVSILGHSMGGYIGLYLLLHYPNRVQNVFTVGTILNWTESVFIREMGMADPKVMETKIPAFCEILSNRHQNWKQLVQSLNFCMEDIYKNQYINSKTFQENGTSICLSIGDKDQTAGVMDTLTFIQTWKGSQFMVFPSTPHPWEKIPLDILSQALIRFNIS